jgi:L-ascorbate metabolism protein UlaG (beta-lactamase superfamily)
MKPLTVILTATLLLVMIVQQDRTPAVGDQKTEEKKMKTDIIKTDDSELKITFIGHATLMLKYQGKIIHIDPVRREADYAKLPKADLVLVTHEHSDHFDPNAIKAILKNDAVVVLTDACRELLGQGTVMKNSDVLEIKGLRIEAVAAYNIVHKRPNGQPFHPKGRGNGYLIDFDKTRLYAAGDTENVPEMKQLKNVRIAFLPMNLPYTMTPEMVADAAKVFNPSILYPYHYGQTNPNNLVEFLKGSSIDVRIREMR